jgi:hypothetical protein
MASFENVSNELVHAILLHLPPQALIQARKVCRRWRALVADIEDRDRPFRYKCGGACYHVQFEDEEDEEEEEEEEASSPPLKTARTEDGDEQPDENEVVEEDADEPLAPMFETMEAHEFFCEDGVWPCSCGRPVVCCFAKNRKNTDKFAAHSSPPLDRWEVLSTERALAHQLALVASNVDSRYFDYGFDYNDWPNP